MNITPAILPDPNCDIEWPLKYGPRQWPLHFPGRLWSWPQRPLGCGRSPNHISVAKGHGSDVKNRPLKHCNDISSPKLCDNLNYLLNGSSSDIRPFNITKIFIETKAAAIKLQGFSH